MSIAEGSRAVAIIPLSVNEALVPFSLYAVATRCSKVSTGFRRSHADASLEAESVKAGERAEPGNALW